MESLTAYLRPAMESGILRNADARAASQHLISLIQAETMSLCLLGLPAGTSRVQIRQVVGRALAVFLAAYGAD